MEVEKAVLGITDCIIIALSFLVCAGIGIYFRFSGNRQQTTLEYLLAGKNQSILSVTFSLMASSYSAISMIGVTAEGYRFGVQLLFSNIGTVIAGVIVSYLALPVYFDMQGVTIYEVSFNYTQ